MDKLRLAVVGSRTFKDKERLYKILDSNIDKIEMLISGCANGADTLAFEWAKERGVPIMLYPAKWYTLDGEYDRGAGFKRNYLIVKASNCVCAFWDKKSKGTQNTIETAQSLGVKVIIKYFEPEEAPPE
jgi:hypothetical protein